MKPLFKKADAIVIKVPSLDEGLAFYQAKLGHKLQWRNETMAALALPDTDTELVLSTTIGPETDILVDSVMEAVEVMKKAGGKVIVGPSNIPVGKVAVVQDPFGNRLTLVDLSKGTFRTDQKGNVIGLGQTQ